MWFYLITFFKMLNKNKCSTELHMFFLPEIFSAFMSRNDKIESFYIKVPFHFD